MKSEERLIVTLYLNLFISLHQCKRKRTMTFRASVARLVFWQLTLLPDKSQGIFFPLLLVILLSENCKPFDYHHLRSSEHSRVRHGAFLSSSRIPRDPRPTSIPNAADNNPRKLPRP